MPSSVVVDNNGTKLAYIDSGAPSSGSVYTTIFAVHGVEFTGPIFQKVSSLLHTKGVRFVAINRRGYKGSTPFTEADMAVLTGGTDSQKAEWLKQRGFEFANFVDTFIQREKLPPASADGKKGGVALLGWSSGTTFTTATIAHVDALPAQVQARLASHLRVHILQEPPSIAFGLPFPPQTWSPQIDPSIPEDERIGAFTLWITSYFRHGDLSTRNTDVLEYVHPATFRKPSLKNMSKAEIADIVEEEPNVTVDTPFGLGCMPQAHAVYKKATFDKALKAKLPHLKIWEVTGDATASFSLAALWSIQDDDKANGGKNLNYRIVPRVNHFMHWDEPEKAVEVYLEALS